MVTVTALTTTEPGTQPITELVAQIAPAAPKVASASLGNHESKLVTLEQLATFPTPEATDTWKPIPHHSVPGIITEMVLERGWKFARDEANRFKLSVTSNGAKMFGVTEIIINGGIDEEFGLALGFRNSHDRTFALRLAAGSRVFVCDNMMITGDVQIRRVHSVGIDVRKVVMAALDQIPEAAHRIADFFTGLRSHYFSEEQGVHFLAQAVEVGALPISDFMDARKVWIDSYRDVIDPKLVQISHPGTQWAAYQAVTASWKKHSLMQVQDYSKRLNGIVPGARLMDVDSFRDTIWS